MTLFETLQRASSEEDVKDAYIKALGLKGYQKNLIDIQTKEIWFEAKQNSKLSSYAMFTQLLHYVQEALNNGEELPPFLAVIDTEKAALMKTADVLPLLEKKNIKWGKSASSYTQEALDAVSAYINPLYRRQLAARYRCSGYALSICERSRRRNIAPTKFTTTS